MKPDVTSASPQPASSRIEPARVELPPDLPMPVFTSTSSFEIARVHALALYCSDGRYGDAFDDFCHRRLDIPRYDRLAVPGGPAWLAHGPIFASMHVVGRWRIMAMLGVGLAAGDELASWRGGGTKARRRAAVLLVAAIGADYVALGRELLPAAFRIAPPVPSGSASWT